MSRASSFSKNLSSLEAEGLVAAELRRQGWRVLARNLRQHGFELDVVATKGSTLVFLEVKARTFAPRNARDFETLLSPGKRRALKRGGDYFCAQFRASLEQVTTMRFDLAVVSPDRSGLHIKYFPDVLG